MDVNSIKATIESAVSVTEIRTILKTASDNNIVLDTQYLKDLLSQQSIEVEGKTGITLFYSGGLQTDGNGGTVPLSSDGYQAWQIAENIGKNNSRIITIGQTDAYALLDSDEFKDALRLSSTDNAAFNRVINGITENGIRIEPGLWDIISQRVAESAVGEVRTLTPFSLSDKVFAQTELPALLANGKVTSVDGIARDDLLRLLNDKGGIGNADALEAVRSAIAAQSWLKALDLDVGIDSATGKLLVGDSDFFNINSNVTGSELPADVINRTAISELMGSIHDSQWDLLRQGADNLSRIDTLSALEQGVDKLGKLGTAADVLTLVLASHDAYAAYEAGDTAGAATIMAEWSARFGAGFAGGVELAGLAAAFSAPIALTGPAGAGAATVFTVAAGITGALLGEAAAEFAIDMGRKYDLILNEASSLMETLFNGEHEISDSIANLFTSATQAIQPIRRDPLVLDLDNDGLETTGINATNPILFDHNANGIKTATGWVNADDAFLVLDKNANGVIDNGRELFGDAMLKSNGQLAVDGFDALRDLDSNIDGKVDASDAQFANLRLWRDLNQDGISQGNELFTIDSQKIAAINVDSSDHSQILSNGNQLADLGSFSKSDGSSGTLGEVSGNIGDINLVQDTFHSQFTDQIDTSAVANLPDIQGSGQVRDLREAAFLSATLAQLLNDFAAAGTPSARQALLDPILKAWSDTSAMPTTFTGAYSGHALTVNGLPAPGAPERQAWEAKITLLEHFNGRTFHPVPDGTAAATLTFWSGNLALLNQSYNALSESVYHFLLLQTHLVPLFKQIDLVWNNATNTFQLSLSALATVLADLYATDRNNALDLTIEMSRWLKSESGSAGFNLAEFQQALQTLSPQLENAYLKGQRQLIGGSDSNNTSRGGDSEEWIRGGTGNDSLYGGNADDMLDGEDDNDTLYGDAGNDRLDGGMGNDTLNGGNGSDIYILRQGSGYDVINQSDSSVGRVDVVHFEDVLPADIRSVQRVVNDLILSYGETDVLTVRNHFSNAVYRIDQIRFADGTVWDHGQINDRTVTTGTSGNDSITGYNGSANIMSGLDGSDYLYGGDKDDTIDGGAGNDSLSGRAGNDILTGSEGNDTLNGEAGNDNLDSGAGNDILSGGDGNDSLDAGSGNDTLNGGNGSDIYILRQGSGYDVISQTDSSAGRNDTVYFEDVLPADIRSVQRVVNDLILSYGETDVLTVRNHFSNAVYRIDQIRFADGTVWDQGQINDRTVTTGTSGNDSITGYNGSANIMSGLDGSDYLYGGDKDDTIDGGAGNDSLSGRAGNDILTGSEGNDTLNGEAGNDNLDSGAGNDILSGGDGNDSLDAGSGNDTLNGGNGSDIYILRQGSGYDVISQTDSSAGRNDMVYFEDVLPADIRSVQRVVNDLILSYGESDVLTVRNHFSNAVYRIDQIRFADGTVWDHGQINDRTVTTGTSGNDSITGYNGSANIMSGLDGSDYLYGGDSDDVMDGGAGNDSLSGRAGNDILTGSEGNDTLNGEAGNDNLDSGAGNDILSGGDGNDSLDAGSGNDTLNGGNGSDIYILRQGSGYDVISQTDSSAGRNDTVYFEDVLPADIRSVQRVVNDLILSYGETDVLTVRNHFMSAVYRIDEIRFADGTVWGQGQINDRTVTTGTSGNDSITGYNGSANIMSGLSGNDYLYGGDSDDVIDGGDDNDSLSGRAGNDTLIGGEGNDTLNGGEGDDSLIGGVGKDTYILTETTAATDTLRISAGDSLVSSFDVVSGFKLGSAAVDKLDLDYAFIADNVSAVDGIDSGIIRSHSIVNGKISFDDMDEYMSSLALTASNLTNVYSYLQNNIITAGCTVTFTASGNTYVFQDDGISDTLVQLTGIAATSISTTGSVAGGVWIT